MVVDTVTITVDVRERRSGVPRLLAELGLVVELVTLAVGDYAIRSRVIERKTVSTSVTRWPTTDSGVRLQLCVVTRTLALRPRPPGVSPTRTTRERSDWPPSDHRLPPKPSRGHPGIGIDQAKALIDEFGSIAAVASASPADLETVRGIGPERAQAVLKALAPQHSQARSDRHLLQGDEPHI